MKVCNKKWRHSPPSLEVWASKSSSGVWSLRSSQLHWESPRQFLPKVWCKILGNTTLLPGETISLITIVRLTLCRFVVTLILSAVILTFRGTWHFCHALPVITTKIVCKDLIRAVTNPIISRHDRSSSELKDWLS